MTFGGGLGSYLADWIVDGNPSKRITSMDITRFAPRHNSLTFVQERSVETEGNVTPAGEGRGLKGRGLGWRGLLVLGFLIYVAK